MSDRPSPLQGIGCQLTFRAAGAQVCAHTSRWVPPPLFRHERLRLAHDAGHCATDAVQSISAVLPASPKGGWGSRTRLLTTNGSPSGSSNGS